MERNVIGLLEDAVEIADHFHAIRECPCGKVGIVAHHVHLEGEHALRDAAADVAAADDAEGLAVQGVLADLQLGLIEILDPGLVQDGHVAAALEHQQDRGLRDGGAVGDRCVQGLHAVVVAGLDVERVEAGAVADDDLEVRVGLDDLAVDGCDADDHGIRLILFHIGQDVFGLKAASGNQCVACVEKELSALFHDLLR